MKITITPIGSTIKNNASITNYNEQKVLVESNEEQIWRWDDSRCNEAKPGELFAFFFPRAKKPKCDGKVIIHKIITVQSCDHRLSSWSTWVGQNNRNVLELSQPIKVYTMIEWEQLCGPMKRMGTYTTDLSYKQLLCHDLHKCLTNQKITELKGIKEEPKKTQEQEADYSHESDELKEEFIIEVVLEDDGVTYG